MIGFEVYCHSQHGNGYTDDGVKRGEIDSVKQSCKPGDLNTTTASSRAQVYKNINRNTFACNGVSDCKFSNSSLCRHPIPIVVNKYLSKPYEPLNMTPRCDNRFSSTKDTSIWKSGLCTQPSYCRYQSSYLNPFETRCCCCKKECVFPCVTFTCPRSLPCSNDDICGSISGRPPSENGEAREGEGEENDIQNDEEFENEKREILSNSQPPSRISPKVASRSNPGSKPGSNPGSNPESKPGSKIQSMAGSKNESRTSPNNGTAGVKVETSPSPKRRPNPNPQSSSVPESKADSQNQSPELESKHSSKPPSKEDIPPEDIIKFACEGVPDCKFPSCCSCRRPFPFFAHKRLPNPCEPLNMIPRYSSAFLSTIDNRQRLSALNIQSPCSKYYSRYLDKCETHCICSDCFKSKCSLPGADFTSPKSSPPPNGDVCSCISENEEDAEEQAEEINIASVEVAEGEHNSEASIVKSEERLESVIQEIIVNTPNKPTACVKRPSRLNSQPASRTRSGSKPDSRPASVSNPGSNTESRYGSEALSMAYSKLESSLNPEDRTSYKPESRTSPDPYAQGRISSKRESRNSCNPESRNNTNPESRNSAYPESRSSHKPESRNSANGEGRTSYKSESRNSPNPEGRASFKPVSRNSTNPDSRASYRPESRSSPNPDGRSGYRAESRSSPNPDGRTSNKTESRNSANPESRASYKPESGNSPNPEGRASFKPVSRNSTNPDSRASYKPESRSSPNPDSRASYKLESRSSPNPNGRARYKSESRRSPNPNGRNSYKPESRNSANPESRVSYKPESRSSPNPEGRASFKPVSRNSPNHQGRSKSLPASKFSSPIPNSEPTDNHDIEPESRLQSKPPSDPNSRPDIRSCSKDPSMPNSKPLSRTCSKPETVDSFDPASMAEVISQSKTTCKLPSTTDNRANSQVLSRAVSNPGSKSTSKRKIFMEGSEGNGEQPGMFNASVQCQPETENACTLTENSINGEEATMANNFVEEQVPITDNFVEEQTPNTDYFTEKHVPMCVVGLPVIGKKCCRNYLAQPKVRRLCYYCCFGHTKTFNHPYLDATYSCKGTPTYRDIINALHFCEEV